VNDVVKIPEPELIEKFESLLGQLATFIGRFLRTAAIVALRPARVPDDVSVHSRLGPGVRVRFRLKPFGLSVEGENFRSTLGF